MNIFNMVATLTLDVDDYKKEMDKAKKENKSFKNDTDKNSKKVGQMWLKAIAIIAALSLAIFKATKSSISYGNAIADNSKKIGISTTDYQIWTQAIQEAGGSGDDINSVFSTMNDLLDGASQGEADATAKLAELGLTYSDFAGMSNEEAFEKIISSLQNMADGTDKTRIIQDLFGDDIANSLIPILNNNAMSVDDLKEYYLSLGGIMSEDTAKSADSLEKQMTSLSTQFKSTGTELMAVFYPALSTIADWFSTAVKWIRENQASFGTLLGIISAGILAITIALGVMGKIPVVAAITAIVLALAGLVAGITLLVQNWDKVEAYFTEQYNSGWLHWMKVAVEAVKGWFRSLEDFFSNFGANVSNMFSRIWDGITAGFKAFCNFFIDGMNGLISGLNKISFTLPDWMGGAHFGINIPLIPRLQKGEDFVPNDFYPAYLDYGERVLTRKENEKYSALGGVSGMESLVNGIGGAVSQDGSVRSTGDIKVYVQIGDKDFKNYTYKVVDTAMKQKGYKSLRKVGSYND